VAPSKKAKAPSLLALGYPHMMVLGDDEPPADAFDPARVFKRYPTDVRHLPRSFARRYLAALYAGGDDDERAVALRADPEPLSAKELAKRVASRFVSTSLYVDTEMYLYEVLYDRATVAEISVKFLEDYKSKDWRGGDIDDASDAIQALYFILLRLPEAQRKPLRARLEKLFARLWKAQKEDGPWRPLKALDTILHGAKGVERSGYRSAEGDLFQDLIFADDDPKFVAKHALAVLKRLKPGDWARFDVRIAHLGGAAVKKALKASVTKFRKEQKKMIAVQLEQLA
jgi:hypothetical protein